MSSFTFFLSRHDPLTAPLSFPTRRSSDLLFARARHRKGVPSLTLHVRSIQVLGGAIRDRKSTRLNSSHTVISYAVFCLKKKIIGHRHCEGVGLDPSEEGGLRG